MLKRILAGGLAVVMAVGMLTGCGSSNANSSAGALTTIPEEAKQDIISYLTDGAISSEETVMTINGVEVPASAYFYQWAYFGGYISDNYYALADAFNLTKEQVVTLARNSFETSWISDEQKAIYIAELEEYERTH